MINKKTLKGKQVTIHFIKCKSVFSWKIQLKNNLLEFYNQK